MKVKLTPEQVTALREMSSGLPQPIPGFTLPGPHTKVTYELPYLSPVKITKTGIKTGADTMLALTLVVGRTRSDDVPSAIAGPIYRALIVVVTDILALYVYQNCSSTVHV